MCIEAAWPTLRIGRCGLSDSENVRARDRAAQGLRKRRLGLGLGRGTAAKSGGRRVAATALALFSTTLMTAGLAFFWAVAAHITTTEVVGRASAVISAMQLIGRLPPWGSTFC